MSKLMMQDPFPTLPSCFSSSEKFSVDPTPPFSSAKPGQSIRTSVYRTKIHGQAKLITVTWCRNLLIHGLSIAIQDADKCDVNEVASAVVSTCKVDLKPWYFWRKEGRKKMCLKDKSLINVYWDLRHAKFSGEPEPNSNYYVALVVDDQMVMLLGDMRKEACKRVGIASSIDASTLLSKKEHVFGKKRFATKAKFSEKGKYHEVLIECGSSGIGGKLDPQMVVKIDGNVVIHVKHLQWKFRGNETINAMNKERVEVYWDVHDWLFSPGMKHALFIFKPLPSVHSSLLTASLGEKISAGINGGDHHGSSSTFCLFLYAWKIE